jgi:hypothetical protein
MWHTVVLRKLRRSGLFRDVTLTGVKVRAALSETAFLDIYYDPTGGSYSYALIDLTSPYAGDKRVLGWDDYPHEKADQIRKLDSFPHHYQYRGTSGEWVFVESPMRGRIEQEMDVIIAAIREYVRASVKRG